MRSDLIGCWWLMANLGLAAACTSHTLISPLLFYLFIYLSFLQNAEVGFTQEHLCTMLDPHMREWEAQTAHFRFESLQQLLFWWSELREAQRDVDSRNNSWTQEPLRVCYFTMFRCKEWNTAETTTLNHRFLQLQTHEGFILLTCCVLSAGFIITACRKLLST